VSAAITAISFGNPAGLFLTILVVTVVVSLMLKKGKVQMVKNLISDFVLNLFTNILANIAVAA
jgi:hypothetical protein